MSNIVEAEWNVIQERTLPVIISEIKIIEQNTARVVLENGIQIGQRLQEAKEKVGHGGFGEWCRENLNYSQDTAQKFMRLAKEYGDPDSLLTNTAMSRNFSISNALSLLKVPEEDREEFVQEHPVEDMTNKALEEEIRKLKEEREIGIVVVQRMQDEKEQADEEIRMLKDDLQNERDQAIEAHDRMQAANEEAAAAEEKANGLKEKLDKAKEKLKKEKDDRQKEIDAAIEKERQGIIEQVNAEAAGRMEQIAGENDELREKLTETERRLERAARGTVIQFKVLTDQLQDIFEKCGELIINEADQETAHKMNGALRLIVEQFMEEL